MFFCKLRNSNGLPCAAGQKTDQSFARKTSSSRRRDKSDEFNRNLGQVEACISLEQHERVPGC